MADAVHLLGGIDVFVHAVGINRRKPIEEYTDGDWNDIIQINLSSAFFTAQAALPGMRAQGHGRIVFFSSVAGRTARPGNGVSAATKWGINGWSESLRRELLPDVRVTLIKPGAVATELPDHITRTAGSSAAPASR